MRLTDVQREQLTSDGYIVVRQALSVDEIARLTKVVAKYFDQHSQAGAPKPESGPGGGQLEDRSGTLANAIEKSDELIVLLDQGFINT